MFCHAVRLRNGSGGRRGALMALESGWYHFAFFSRPEGRREARMGQGDPKEETGQDRGKPGIKVTDRRHFTADGERRPDVSDDIEAGAAPAAVATEAPAERSTPPKHFERRPLDEPEGVDFTMLINAMAQPALLYLGEIPHPATGQPTLDLEGARLQIDMLDLLRVKSRGNLTPQEESLLESVLYQLRMRYVARSGGPA